MFRMIAQDLRISPGRALLTGLSMFIGILAVIVSVLAGTVGREYLSATNTQLFGRAPTYSAQVASERFSDPSALAALIRAVSSAHLQAAFSFTPQDEPSYISNRSLSDPPQTADLASAASVDAVYTTARYASVYNLPMTAGRWLTPEDAAPRLELVANKPAAQSFPLHSYAYATSSSTVTLTPLEVVGVVNDGLTDPRVYVNVEGIATLAPRLWSSSNATFVWHDDTGRTPDQRLALVADLLHDHAPGAVGSIGRSDSLAYEEVIRIISVSFAVVSALLLVVAAIGLINIGLASIEQRSHELLIRRALGATRGSVAVLVIGSSLVLAVLVAGAAVLLSVVLVASVPHLLPADSPVAAPAYPAGAALVAVAAAIATSLVSSIAPAVRAIRLQPALALR